MLREFYEFPTPLFPVHNLLGIRSRTCRKLDNDVEEFLKRKKKVLAALNLNKLTCIEGVRSPET